MRQTHKNEDYHPEMPPLSGGAYLVGYLFEVGPVMSTGMGPSIVTHQELQAWQHGMGLVLEPWEIKFIRRLSSEYIGEQARATDRSAFPPWSPDDEDSAADNAVVAKSMKDAIRAMAR
jgi:hypothetical protein